MIPILMNRYCTLRLREVQWFIAEWGISDKSLWCKLYSFSLRFENILNLNQFWQCLKLLKNLSTYTYTHTQNTEYVNSKCYTNEELAIKS